MDHKKNKTIMKDINSTDNLKGNFREKTVTVNKDQIRVIDWNKEMR
jgi:hypothetical protein